MERCDIMRGNERNKEMKIKVEKGGKTRLQDNDDKKIRKTLSR